MKRVAAACAALCCLTTMSISPFGMSAARAEWPHDKPIRILVGFAPGGGTDIVARLVAQPVADILKATAVVENKPGAGSSLAAADLARADKDGYTASVISSGHVASAVMVKSVRYDAVKDFAPVAMIGTAGFVVVARKDFPADDIKGLIAMAKASPGKMNFASVGVGSAQHFTGEMLRQMAGIDVKHIPYRTTPAVVTALRAGEVDFTVELIQTVRGQIDAGELKALAVSTEQRQPSLPNVPTVSESGVPGYLALSWYGWLYPAGTPQPVIDKTYAALKDVLARPDVQAQIEQAGATVEVRGPAAFGKHVADEVVKWGEVREKAGLEPM